MVAKRKSTTHAQQETSKNPGKTIVSDSHKSTAKTAPKKNGTKTKILKPKSGEKLQHILLAEKNATESIKLKKTSIKKL